MHFTKNVLAVAGLITTAIASTSGSTGLYSSATSSISSSSTTCISSQTSAITKTSSTTTTSILSQSQSLTTSLAPSISPVAPPHFSPEWYLSGHRIPSGKGNLWQNQTNGKSRLGSFQAPKYPPFIDYNGNSDSFPWSPRTAADTNPYQDSPDTGVVRSYTFVVERGTLAPDGVPKPVILVNGEFPGPTIEADWGDTFEITVINKITGPEEGTAIHWHGLLQKGTPFMDGVPGITQHPIAPGQTFTYSFKADLYGTSWWHAHYSAQYAAGIFGAMIIHGPTDNAQYDVDLGPVMVTDYYHTGYWDLVQDSLSTDLNRVIVYSDNNLINGKGIFNCTYAAPGANCDPNAGLSKFHFQQGKSYRLRLINGGAEGMQKFSIDNHKMSVIAYDFVPIVPYETDIVTLGVGQRADIVVTATGQPTDIVWMRSTMTKCANTKQPNALAIIYYDNADPNAKPNTTAWPDNTDPCANDDLTTSVPFYPIELPNPDLEIELDINFGQNSTGHFIFEVNNSTFRADYNNPVLPFLESGQATSSCPTEWNVYDIGKARSTRITINNFTPIEHPMHLHGHNYFVLSTGSTIPTGPAPIVNAQNPTRRDTQILPPKGQIVIQVNGDNPGTWPLHCHIAWHVSGGLYVTIAEDVESLRQIPTPASVTALGTSWDAFTNQQDPDQIDSGL